MSEVLGPAARRGLEVAVDRGDVAAVRDEEAHHLEVAGTRGVVQRRAPVHRVHVEPELDEDLLDEFHGTVSLPFESGDQGRLAVKIVDDRGIESLRIMPLEG